MKNASYAPPTLELINWPDILTADEDDEKAFSGLLTED